MLDLNAILTQLLGPVGGLIIAVVLNRYGIKLPGQPNLIPSPPPPALPSQPTQDAGRPVLLDLLRQLAEFRRARRAEEQAISTHLAELQVPDGKPAA